MTLSDRVLAQVVHPLHDGLPTVCWARAYVRDVWAQQACTRTAVHPSGLCDAHHRQIVTGDLAADGL